MSRYEHGRVLAVNETTLGSELVGDHAAGVGSLTVEDPVDFDEDGGWLSINGQVVEYSTYDDDTGEITLVGTLDAAAGEGDRVDLWDELRQVVTVDKIAQVELDGDDDNTDPLEATIPLHLLDDLAEGIRGIRGESVLLEQDGDEWRIVDVLGLASQGASGNQFWEDQHAVTATGQQTITLTHEPINNSEHLYWNGLYQPASEWSRNGQTITVPDSGGDLQVGDQLVVEYAYRVGVASATPDYVGSTSASSSTVDVSTLAVNVPAGTRPGDLLLLAATRIPINTPAGWTPLVAVDSTHTFPTGTYGTGPLRLQTFYRIADGTEPATVTLQTTGGYTSILTGMLVAYRAAGVAATTVDKVDPALPSDDYTPPETTPYGSLQVSFSYYDGDGSGGEAVAVQDGLGREVINAGSRNYGLALIEGGGTLNDPAPAASTSGHFWLSAAIGLRRE